MIQVICGSTTKTKASNDKHNDTTKQYTAEQRADEQGDNLWVQLSIAMKLAEKTPSVKVATPVTVDNYQGYERNTCTIPEKYTV